MFVAILKTIVTSKNTQTGSPPFINTSTEFLVTGLAHVLISSIQLVSVLT